MHTTIIYGEAGMTPSKKEIILQLVYEIKKVFAQAGDKENALTQAAAGLPSYRSHRDYLFDLFDAHRLLIRQRAEEKYLPPIPGTGFGCTGMPTW